MPGTKEAFSGSSEVEPHIRHLLVESSLARGALRQFQPFNIMTEGGLLRHQKGGYSYLPPVNRRGDGWLKPIHLHGLKPDPKSYSDFDPIGIEIEQWVINKRRGTPAPVRFYDPDHRYANEQGLVRYYDAAALTPEMTTDLDERTLNPNNIYPVDISDLPGELEVDVARNVTAFDHEGVAVSLFAITPHEVTDDRLEQQPYVAGIISDPHYRRYFVGTGIQFHRAIRKHCETPEQALEFGAFVANRLPAYSWAFQLLSGASPDLAGKGIEHYYADSERMTDEDKKVLRNLTGKRDIPGHSIRTIGRHAGSQSGGIHRDPIPESANGLLTSMHEALGPGRISSPARITGEHADIRLRYDIDPIAGHGTFETSVPDTTFRAERTVAMVQIYDALISRMYKAWKSGDSHHIIGGTELIGQMDEISSDQLKQFRYNSFAVALHGPNAYIKRANGLHVSARKAMYGLLKELDDPYLLTDESVQEVKRSLMVPDVKDLDIDKIGLPSYDNYFTGKAPSPSFIFAARKEALVLKGSTAEQIRDDALLFGAAALRKYARRLVRDHRIDWDEIVGTEKQYA